LEKQKLKVIEKEIRWDLLKDLLMVRQMPMGFVQD
jgi:hypothetical protein